MISGSMVALVTPMLEGGALDWDKLAGLVEFHIEKQTDAIVAVGTTGESATLNFDEHSQVIKFIVERAKGRIPIIAGTGANCTQEAIELTQAAKLHKADACLLVSPYYNKPTQEGLYLHHKAIAEAVAIPQILYNVPGRTAVDMLPETVARLSNISNIIGIKEATGDVQRGKEILNLCGENLSLYSGDDETAMELMLAGAKGNISVTANIAPAEMKALCDLAMAGNRELAEATNEPLKILHSTLFLESNPIPVKWALKEMGLIEEYIRLPMTVLSERHRQTLKSALDQAGI